MINFQRLQALALVGLLPALGIATGAAAQDVQFKNLEKVILLLPPGLTEGEKTTLGFRRRLITFEETEKGLVVGGREDWKSSAFPQMAPCTAWKPRKFKDRPGWIRMELSCAGHSNGRFLIAKGEDPEKVKPLFQQVLMPRSTSSEVKDAYLREVGREIGRLVFQGPLASYPEEARVPFVLSFYAEGARTLEQEEYKDEVYLLADLGIHDEIFNTIQMKRSQRLARIFSEKLLSSLSSVSNGLEKIDGLGGIAFRIRVAYKNFVSEKEAGVDTVEVYAALEQAQKFANDDLTGQQFLDAVVVRVNDSRTEVRLSDD